MNERKIKQTFTLSKNNIDKLNELSKIKAIKKSTFIDKLLTSVFFKK